MEEKKNNHYLSGKEVRAIAKANAKEMANLVLTLPQKVVTGLVATLSTTT